MELRRQVELCLTAALVDLVRTNPSMDCTTAGIHAFRVERPFPWVRAIQARIGRVKLASTPAPTGIVWTRGKGVIARCWEEQSLSVADLAYEFGLLSASLAASEWDALPPNQRYGLSFAEFQRTQDVFGVVIAVPMITESGRYVGCVSFDVPAGSPDLDEMKVIDRLNTCAHLLRILLEVRGQVS